MSGHAVTEENGQPMRRVLLWGFLIAVILAVLVTALMAPKWRGEASLEVPPELGAAPTFLLVNRDGGFAGGRCGVRRWARA